MDAPNHSTTDNRWTVARILEWTTGHLERHGSETPRLDTEILLARARGCRRIELYTDFDQELSDDQRATMRDLVMRRAAAEPVAYLVGFREFFGLDFQVTPDVLIPRPDTETVVVELLDRARGLDAPRVLDVGTGSGCIAITVAVRLPGARVTATDISAAAIEVARGNAGNHGVTDRINFACGDLYSALDPGDHFDVIASNPPYVSRGELEELSDDIRLHEPHAALDGGDDGLDIVRRLVSDAAGHLHPAGWLLLEISPEQAEAVTAMVIDTGMFDTPDITTDLANRDRVVAARRITPR